jgi:glucosamine 6-phosphate synthetase-like amidotransferase/phosphosugar isomerase protein
MCGIAGYSLDVGSRLDRTVAARALLAGIAERGADAVGYAHRRGDGPVSVHKQRSGASALLERLEIPADATQVLIHVRDYTKGHPTIASNNHPIRHGSVVGIHNGIVVNDDELFEFHGIERAEPEMTVDSEIIFALAARSRGRTVRALEQLRGSLATAWLDEARPELVLARGMGRPLWVGRGRHELVFASTRGALELVERICGVALRKREVPLGTLLAVDRGRIVARQSFRPDLSFEEEPLPAVRAPHEGAATLQRLLALHPAAA